MIIDEYRYVYGHLLGLGHAIKDRGGTGPTQVESGRAEVRAPQSSNAMLISHKSLQNR